MNNTYTQYYIPNIRLHSTSHNQRQYNNAEEVNRVYLHRYSGRGSPIFGQIRFL